jgi:hypothetical protein
MAGCPTQHKRCHPDYETAIAAAIRLSARRGVALRVYQCPHCQSWHLTKRCTPIRSTRETMGVPA